MYIWRMENGILALIDLSVGIFFCPISGWGFFSFLSRVRAIECIFVESVSEQVVKILYSRKGGDEK